MFDLIALIKTAGYVGVSGIIFAESFIIFFLPGDSLLVMAGFLASQGFLNLYVLMGLSLAGAVIGNNLAYYFGRKIGPKIFTKEDSVLFRHDRIEQSRKFYEKYGAKTIILARFIPFVRTFAPILAGVAGMSYRQFVIYNIIGAILWTIGLPLAGYYLGQTVDVDRYILPIIALIVILSLIPVIIELNKNRKK